METTCFNGAAVFQLRKCEININALKISRRLQWSRSFSTAEILLGITLPPFNERFNGAAVFQLRKSVGCGVPRPHGMASMEPQFFNCGNPLETVRITTTKSFNGAAVFQLRKWLISFPLTIRWAKLQWSRSFSTAEIGTIEVWAGSTAGFNGAAVFQLRKCPLQRRPERRGVASMEPQFFNCGNFKSSDAERAMVGASMEPQFFNCGNQWVGLFKIAYQGSFNGAAVFQLRKYS